VQRTYIGRKGRVWKGKKATSLAEEEQAMQRMSLDRRRLW
jgi:hypothetical protein